MSPQTLQRWNVIAVKSFMCSKGLALARHGQKQMPERPDLRTANTLLSEMLQRATGLGDPMCAPVTRHHTLTAEKQHPAPLQLCRTKVQMGPQGHTSVPERLRSLWGLRGRRCSGLLSLPLEAPPYLGWGPTSLHPLLQPWHDLPLWHPGFSLPNTHWDSPG